MECDVLVLAGLWNSGPQHWQTLWERKHPGWTRAPHRDWNNPVCHEWVAELDAAIAASEGGPPILVAPSDVDAPSYPKEASGFGPMPLQRLPFPSIVVASSNDEYVSLERARAFAEAWGSKFVEIGEAGHINGASGYGDWPEGEKMLLAFCDELKR
jgi:predicted alpha/beta hydrolase family esterase